MKEEISRLKKQLTLLQSVRQLEIEASGIPPHVTLQLSDKNIFQIERQSQTNPPYFRASGNFLFVLFTGYYQVVIDFNHKNFWRPGSLFSLCVNDRIVRSVGQDEGDSHSLLVALLMLNSNDCLSIRTESSFGSRRFAPAQMDIVLIQGNFHQSS